METRVSTLELFFDLVFVFTITQLTAVLYRQSTALGFFSVVLMLGVIWWMYGGYAWLTNAVPPNRADRRLLLMVGMAGFLLIALSVPRAFGGSGLAFGIGYLVVTIVHAGLFTRSDVPATVQAVFRIARFNLASALLVLSAGSPVVAASTSSGDSPLPCRRQRRSSVGSRASRCGRRTSWSAMAWWSSSRSESPWLRSGSP